MTSTVMSMSVCLSVCLSAWTIQKTTWPNFTTYLVHAAHGFMNDSYDFTSIFSTGCVIIACDVCTIA